MSTVRRLLGTSVLVPWVVATSATPSAASPATDLCMKDGATIVAETAASGSQHNVCVFPNGARINEWAYFRNKHRTTH